MIENPLPIVSRRELLIFDEDSNFVAGYLKKKKSTSIGKLDKLPRSTCSRWQKRWFWVKLDLLDNENYCLCYSRTKSLHPIPRKSLQCAGSRLVIHNATTFSIHSLNYHPLILSCESDVEAYRWTATLAHIFAVAEMRAESLSQKLVPNEKYGQFEEQQDEIQRRNSLMSSIDSFENQLDTNEGLPVDEDDTSNPEIYDENDEDDSSIDENQEIVQNLIIEMGLIRDSEDTHTTFETTTPSHSRSRSLSHTICISPRMQDDLLAETYTRKRDDMIVVPSPEKVLSYRKTPSNHQSSHRLSKRHEIQITWLETIISLPTQLFQVIMTFCLFNILVIIGMIGAVILSLGMLALNAIAVIFYIPFYIILTIFDIFKQIIIASIIFTLQQFQRIPFIGPIVTNKLNDLLKFH